MKIIEKFVAKANDYNAAIPTIAFFGDSVTQGFFEIIPRNDGGFNNVQDTTAVYHTRLVKIFAELFPTVPINIINAGVAGTDAAFGIERIERDVLSKSPDLTVVCFGLNDCGKEEEGRDAYIANLKAIFKRLKEAGSEIIFMTPNMMSTKVSSTIHPSFIELAETLSERQNRGVLDSYMDAARALCREEGIPVCDVYAKWKRMSELGVNVTELLSNKLNHPTREMHNLFATSLVETILQ
ncbi:MAG: GDSL family lipase [Ruminococcaceae bacterium]|nr:GDSL family lipase [Oscillospiraceae bacterium]